MLDKSKVCTIPLFAIWLLIAVHAYYRNILQKMYLKKNTKKQQKKHLNY